MQLFAQILSPILCLAFAPNGRMLLAATHKLVGWWHLPDGKFSNRTGWDDRRVRSFAYAADSSILAVGDDSGKVLPYLTDEPAQTADSLTAWHDYDSEYHVEGSVNALAYAPQQPVLAVAARGVSLWSEETLPYNLDLPGDQFFYGAVAFSRDGKSLAASAIQSRCVAFWRLHPDWQCREHVHFDMPAVVSSVAFSRNGKTLAMACGETVLLRDLISMHQWELTGHKAAIRQLAYSPNGNLLATAGADGVVCLWNARTEQVTNSYDWKIGPLTALVFAPDGMTCAVGSESGKVVVWDVEE